ncbi:neuronal acetylcholine receptor subunit alpha-5-like isoform X2 [Actinia tenebrosa]|uniref:Neuronal acetylcholine receptor subunit alpha-5-like isoform X2 n=1 Tax=Actinia tenebrosa TaxID=6105 RepID=A0A6P8IH37_ACTTE|nr:neuronal acetylcholine receptor subunit alpha-5-like isoform X2 [Actinia tenebrosa]
MNNRQVLLFTAGLLTVMITLVCQDCHATRILMHNVSSEYKLRRELLTNYDRLVRPVLSPLAVVNVSFLVKLLSISDVDSKNEVMTSKVLIEQIWENPYLKWDQSHFDGINRVRMSNKEVWVPDIKLQNSANNPSQDTQHLHENWVTVYSNGTNVWVSIAMISSKCDFDISVFPFDEQKCSIVFASESYDTELLDIYLKQGDQLNLGKKPVKEYLKSTSNGEWETGSFTAFRQVKQSSCCSTPFVHVKIHLRITRIPTFYILYLLSPFIVLSLLVFFSFIIPPDNGERIGFCSSLLLSLSVYLLLFSELMPNNSRKLNLFGVAFVLIFLESAAVLVATLFVLKAYHATGEIPAVFKLLHYCSFFRLGSSIKKRYPLNRAKKNQITNRSHSLNEKEPPLGIKSETAAEDISLANVNQGTRIEQHEPDEEPGDELTWRKVARRLDRFFFWCFLFAFVVTVSIIGMLNQDLGEVEITI